MASNSTNTNIEYDDLWDLQDNEVEETFSYPFYSELDSQKSKFVSIW